MDNHATYFKYWGKAKRPAVVDYCLSNGTDADIAKRYGISLQKLKQRAEKFKWKKVAAGEEYSAFHLLPYHSLDVAAVASVWWDHSQAIPNSFHRYANNLTSDQVKAWVMFFVALHDYGKFDIRFQCKAQHVYDILQKENPLAVSSGMPSIDAYKSYDHGSAGLFLYDHDHNKKDRCGDSEPPFDINDLIESSANVPNLPWIKAVTGHHGFVYSDDAALPQLPLHSTVHQDLAQQDKHARLQWIAALEEIFLIPAGLCADDNPSNPSPLLAGFCAVSDWLGSRSDEENFCYNTKPTTIELLKVYFQERCAQDALRVFKLSGIGGHVKSYQGMTVLLKKGHQPRQLQTLVDDLPDKPGLTIVEAPTGSGKTEIALAYAWRLLKGGYADSIVFALPTQATANAMLKRLHELATKLFEESPNLLLGHGNARFNKEFLALKQADKTIQQNEEAWAQCNEWLSQSRKRLFLGQIGVCTVDQVLVSVLPVRHRFVRGFGVGRSVLIVDEVHAYDAYMYGLLEAVLREQQAVGSPSILLSATLPEDMRNCLLETSGASEQEVTTKASAHYPLVSWSDGKQFKSFYLPKSNLPPEREVQINLLENKDLLPDEVLYQRIICAATQGAQVAIVCNLVDAAQHIAKKLQLMISEEGLPVEVDIFHARYCLKDRQAREEVILGYFGQDGKRKTGRILVATQVIEQSLDIDFDWLITQLCPVDLLFQRMGRLHRHKLERPEGFGKPFCTVILPNTNDCGMHGLIYANSRVMWRTAQKLRDCPEQIIRFPAAYREWIERVYQRDVWGNEPGEVETGFSKFEDLITGKRSAARQMIKWADDVALNDSDEKIRAVTRDGEFNLSVVPYLDTPQGKQLLNGQLYESLSEWQQAEALSMSTVGVPNGWGRGWNRFLPEQDSNGYIWLAMQVQGEYWKVTCNHIELSYHAVWGMEKIS